MSQRRDGPDVLWAPGVATGRRVPSGSAPEERPLTELGARAVSGAVLGKVGGARAGGVEPGHDRTVGALPLPVDGGPQPAEGEAGVQRLAQGQVVGAPRPVVLRGQPVGVLVEVRVLAPGGML